MFRVEGAEKTERQSERLQVGGAFPDVEKQGLWRKEADTDSSETTETSAVTRRFCPPRCTRFCQFPLWLLWEQ